MGGVRYSRHDGEVVPLACAAQSPDAEEALHPAVPVERATDCPFRSPLPVAGGHPLPRNWRAYAVPMHALLGHPAQLPRVCPRFSQGF
jgi:hypothetical protein